MRDYTNRFLVDVHFGGLANQHPPLLGPYVVILVIQQAETLYVEHTSVLTVNLT